MFKQESGFAHVVGVFIAVLVLGVVAFAGYRVMNSANDGAVEQQAVTTPDIKNSQDLDEASKMLDSVEASDQTSDQSDAAKLEEAL